MEQMQVHDIPKHLAVSALMYFCTVDFKFKWCQRTYVRITNCEATVAVFVHWPLSQGWTEGGLSLPRIVWAVLMDLQQTVLCVQLRANRIKDSTLELKCSLQKFIKYFRHLPSEF
jgi:hypothetical protein